MKYININKLNFSKEQIRSIINYIKKGKVIFYPTDTIYGIGCLATNKKAINKIYRIKKRDKSPLLVLVSSFAMLKKYSFISEKQLKYLKKIWQKGKRPSSVILKSKGNLPKELTSGLDSIAVRLPSNLPKHDFLIKIIRGAGVPIVSTSLNISGKEYIGMVDDLGIHFKEDKPDLVVNAGNIKSRKPSKLIDLRDMEDIKVLRK
ncbi:MAG: L-threonylcarbamoyladenylate synthase [Patescibacteria group bacterium]